MANEVLDFIEVTAEIRRRQDGSTVEDIAMETLREVRVFLGEVPTPDLLEKVSAVPMCVPPGDPHATVGTHGMVRCLDDRIPRLLRGVPHADLVAPCDTLLQFLASRLEERAGDVEESLHQVHSNAQGLYVACVYRDAS